MNLALDTLKGGAYETSCGNVEHERADGTELKHVRVI